MAVVNMTPTSSQVTKYKAHQWRWAGSQAWIGNDLLVTIPVDGRPVRGIQAALRGTNGTIPSTATGYALGQAQVNGQWWQLAKIIHPSGTAVGAWEATTTWLRNTVSPTAISATGTLLHYAPWFDNSPNLSGAPLIADAVRLYLSGASLVGTAVAITNNAVGGTPAGGVVTVTCASTGHGLATGDLIRITVATGSTQPSIWSGMVGTTPAVTVTGNDSFTFDVASANAIGTSSTFTYAADWTWKSIGLDVLFAE